MNHDRAVHRSWAKAPTCLAPADTGTGDGMKLTRRTSCPALFSRSTAPAPSLPSIDSVAADTPERTWWPDGAVHPQAAETSDLVPSRSRRSK